MRLQLPSILLLRLCVFLLAFLLPVIEVYAQPGAIDPDYNMLGTGANSQVRTIAIQPDGKILIGGNFTTYNGTTRNHIARLNADGSLDNTFNLGTGTNGSIRTIVLQPDGKILIGGGFTSYNGTLINHIARLNADGSLDNTFNPGTGVNGAILATALQADGKILIGGEFTTYNGTVKNCLARLSADGSLDNTFNTSFGAYNFVYAITIQPDQKVLISYWDSFDLSTSECRVVRLNVNGTSDFFYSGDANSYVASIVLQADGKILIGGWFTSYNGTPKNRIVRQNADGTLDNTFDPGTGADGIVETTCIQPDGKILIGGQFTSYNGTSRNRIARLNADGTLDNTFDPGAGANSNVRAITFQPDGKILIGGDFTSYNSIARNRIFRLLGESTPLPVTWLYFSGKTSEKGNALTWGTVTEKNSSQFIVERSEDGRNFQEIGEVKAAGNSNQQIQYTFTDENATVFASKTIYYRLKQIDLDGSFDYSAVIAVSRQTTAPAVAVHPNPFSDKLWLSGSGGNLAAKTKVQLTTLTGKTVSQQELPTGETLQEVRLSDLQLLPAGIYLLRVQQDNKVEVLKVMKQ